VGIAGRINLQRKLCQETNWLCLYKVQYCGRVGQSNAKKPEIDAEIEWHIIGKNYRRRGIRMEVLRC
jgi:hypothetical protein